MSQQRLEWGASVAMDRQPQPAMWFAFVGLLALAPAVGAEDVIPRDSKIARAENGEQRLLLNPLDEAASVVTGAWKMKRTYAATADRIPVKLGGNALTLGAAEAEQAGAKGDFRVQEDVPGETRTIGLWVHLTDDANVARVGIQVDDAQNEVLLAVVPADWTGWRWVEVDLADVQQAYPQADKNQAVDAPLRSVHVVWFTKAAGRTSLAVDGLVAVTRLKGVGSSGITVDSSVPAAVAAGATLPASVCATNFTEQPARVTVRYSLQQDPAFYSQPLPDPVFGSDNAAGSRSWLVVDGEMIPDTRSTDGKPWTATTTPWQRAHYTEAFQLVDLGQVREVRKLTWLSGDANHSWFVDVWASEDGETFLPAPGLSDVDHHKKWGWHEFPVARPFRARVLKFRYRTAGGQEDLIAFPSELGVYDGADDEMLALPKVGSLMEEGQVSVEVPARSFAMQALGFSKPLEPGAYLLGLSVEQDDARELSYRHVFGGLREQPELIADEPRIGMNAAHADLAPQLRELGTGLVRFENGKWPFVSAQPHQYSFTGDVAPWHVDMDHIFQTYHEAGLGVLTYMFLTPAWASTAPAKAAESMRLAISAGSVVSRRTSDMHSGKWQSACRLRKNLA